jgi:hypothetical protein
MQYDKQLHFVISAFLIIFLSKFGIIEAVIITFILGLLKEIYDKRNNNFDWKDLIANILGILVGYILVL